MKRIMLLAALMATAHANAADADPLRLDNLTVTTATRTATTVDESLSTITVYTRDDIERSQADRLTDVLRFVSGLEVVRTGGPGQQTSLFFRGSESNHTLVLIDSVRMNPATIGTPAVQNMPASMIERIEIVSGPRSSLYGSDAIGGVINVITRSEGAGGDFEARAGGDNAQRVAANAGFAQDGWSLRAGVDTQRTGGIPTRTFTAEDRGYENDAFNVSVQRTFDRGSVSVRHLQAGGITEYADFFGTPVSQDFDNSVTALQWQQQFTAGWDSTLIVSRNVDEIAQRESPDFVESTRTSVDWQNTLKVNDAHTVVAGVLLFNESAETLSFGSGFDEDTDLTAVFVQDQYRNGRFDAIASLRLTDHDAFGNELTWNGAVGFDVTPTLRVQAGGGRAFRAPDATDRFGFGGSPDLEAEISEQWQATGIWKPAENWRLSLELFSNDIEDLIDFDFATFTLQNIAEAEIRGAELRGVWTADSWNVAFGLVNQSVENAATGQRLLRRSEQSATLDVTRDFGDKLDASLTVRADGDREGIGGARLAGYVLVNTGLRYRINDRWQVSANVENLLDADYEPAADFRAQDRRTSVGLRYSW
ncbi:MAG: TonB-dependent receptor [Pseudomonadota bacterium]